MFQQNNNKDIQLIHKQFQALIHDDDDIISLFSNACAFLNVYLDTINWVGFYFLKNDQLVLGPFQGLPACNRIPLTKGVCGYAATHQKMINVADVHQFKGHIACDAASNSEIVIPIFKNNQLIALLDIDSPIKNRFTTQDEQFLKQIVTAIENNI